MSQKLCFVDDLTTKKAKSMRSSELTRLLS